MKIVDVGVLFAFLLAIIVVALVVWNITKEDTVTVKDTTSELVETISKIDQNTTKEVDDTMDDILRGDYGVYE